MAGKDSTANITVVLKGDEAKRYIKGLGDETKKQAQGMKEALGSALTAGLKGGIGAVKEMASGLKNIVTTVGGLAGGIGIAELAKGAIEAKQRWSDLAAGIKFAGGTAEDAAQAQAQAQKSALAWGQDSMKVADAFDAIRGETGSIQFAKDTIDTVAIAARGTHQPLERIAEITGLLNEKFGVTADELPDMLADVTGLGHKGGISMEEMAAKLGPIGAYAKEAGLQGREGFGQMIGMMNMADDALGGLKKGIPAVGGLVEQLGATTGKAKIGAALGISQKDLGGSLQSQIGAIMKATRGQRSQLEKAFGGEQLRLLVDIGSKYAASFDSTKGDVKAKTAAGLAALDSAFQQASQSTVTWATVQKEAGSQMQEGPQKIAVAMERLRQAVARPEVIGAIERMIGALPGLANFFGKLVSFAAENPGAAITAAITANIAKAAIGETVASLFKAMPWKEIGSSMLTMSKGLFTSQVGLGLLAVAATAAAMAISDYETKMNQEQEKLDETPALVKKAKAELAQTGGISEDTMNELAQRSADFAGMKKAAETGGVTDMSYAAILAAKITGGADQVGLSEAKTREAAKLGPEGVTQTSAELDALIAQGVAAKKAWRPGDAAPAVNVPGAPAKAGAPVDTNALAAATAQGIASKEIRVRVTNPNDIGGGGGPTSAGAVSPGWKPR